MNISDSFNRNNLASKIYAIAVLLAVILMLRNTFLNIHWFVYGEDYSSFRISDWLINYADGFIRRGLIGTLLLRFYLLFPHPITITIAIILVLCFLGLLILILKVCREEKLSYALLPTTLFFGILIFPENLGFVRRDHLSLILCYLIFYLYTKSRLHEQNMQHWGYILSFYAFSALTLLIHEAAFFYTFPIIFLHYFISKYNISKKIFSSLKSTFLFSIPISAAFVPVILFNGDAESTRVIWESWLPLFQDFPRGNPESPLYAGGLEALSWQTLLTFKLHMMGVYGYKYFGFFPSFFIMILIFLGVYYLFTNFNTLTLRKNLQDSVNKTALSNILILQFIFMIPLFTILSCDLGRTIPYWTISSLFTYHFFAPIQKSNLLRPLNKLSSNVQKLISCNRVLNSPYFYLMCVFCIPITPYHAPKSDSMLLIRIWEELVLLF